MESNLFNVYRVILAVLLGFAIVTGYQGCVKYRNALAFSLQGEG